MKGMMMEKRTKEAREGGPPDEEGKITIPKKYRQAEKKRNGRQVIRNESEKEDEEREKEKRG